MLAPFAFGGEGSESGMAVVELREDLFAEERTLLERLASLLSVPGLDDPRLDEARTQVEERLRELRGLVSNTGGLPLARGSAVTQHGLIGCSEAMEQVYQAIRRVSESQATVLLRGESGTGKELMAKAIHDSGTRAAGPFVRLHCAAVTESLLESELFGHERGAFTGASEMRKGRFETADGGTLFLDEIGDIPAATQVKLLRVLQERCFERVGGNRPIHVDVRLISATHRDLEAMVRGGHFREDLYYRLNVVPIWLPPLRERTGDIPRLIEHFLSRFNRENRRTIKLGKVLLELMTHYDWPGNVRELQNCVERLVVMADADLVTLSRIPASLESYFSDIRHVTHTHLDIRRSNEKAEPQPLQARLNDIERERLREALVRSGWVQARAGRLLGLTPRQVAYKMKKYGIHES
jgi:Nif-specific regulatory protein